ncbi:hypothetical protein [Chryseobacterium sp.]|uniref:hypothetical protein n=1 Tax=Chryseobacterium sp. TaxID=1871047 RepID=UPI00321A0623
MGVTKQQLEKLKEPLQLKWRVRGLQPDNVNPTHMIIVGYVNPRQVQDRLDDVLGPENWQDDYAECKNKQFCRIGIKINDEWIWKGDSGTETFLDPGKGETSDSFKRAAVHWGINRDTYELGEITIACKMVEGKPFPCDVNGNVLKGELLLNECKRISALNESDLVFDKNVIQIKPNTKKEVLVKSGRNPNKPKVILP